MVTVLLKFNCRQDPVTVLFRNNLGLKFLEIGHFYFVQLSVRQMLNSELLAKP